MNKELIQKKFNDIGADISFSDRRQARFRDNQLVSIDVVENKRGEHFALDNPDDLPVEALDVQPNLRHLLSRDNQGQKLFHYKFAGRPGLNNAVMQLRPVPPWDNI